jgi:hypothetical protein
MDDGGKSEESYTEDAEDKVRDITMDSVRINKICMQNSSLYP